MREVVPLEGLSTYLAEEERGYPAHPLNPPAKRYGKFHIDFSQLSIQLCSYKSYKNLHCTSLHINYIFY